MAEERETADLARRLLSLMPRYVQWSARSLRAHRLDGDPSFRQLAVLFMIREGESSPAGIAQRLGISRAVVTGLLDRLEERGLIRREPDPSDRRRLRIVMTAAGLDASARLGRAVVDDLAAELVGTSPGEQQALARAVALLEQKIDMLLDQTPAPPEAGREQDAWDDEMPAPAPSLMLRN